MFAIDDLVTFMYTINVQGIDVGRNTLGIIKARTAGRATIHGKFWPRYVISLFDTDKTISYDHSYVLIKIMSLKEWEDMYNEAVKDNYEYELSRRIKVRSYMKVWMADMGCLACGKGTYKGYQPMPSYRARSQTKTLPCDVCGDVQLARMTKAEFLRKIKERDQRLEHIDIRKMFAVSRKLRAIQLRFLRKKAKENAS